MSPAAVRMSKETPLAAPVRVKPRITNGMDSVLVASAVRPHPAAADR
jgi:hypothetical protein